MTLRRVQFLLLAIFMMALIVALSAVSYGYVQQQYFDDEYQSLVLVAIGQHAGPLSIVLAALFAISRPNGMRRVDWGTAGAALALAVLWSLLTAGRAVAFIVSPDESVQTLVSWSAVVSSSSFLLDGVLAYFFMSSSK